MILEEQKRLFKKKQYAGTKKSILKKKANPTSNTGTCGWVYIIGNRELGWFKVGRSRFDNLFIRLCSIRNSLPFEAILIAAFKSRAFNKLERHIHKTCSQNKLHHEWFHFELSELETVLNMASIFSESKLSPEEISIFNYCD